MTGLLRTFLFIFLSVAMAFCSLKSYGLQDTTIHKSFGQIYQDEFKGVALDQDSNLVFVGFSSSEETFGTNGLIIKTDTLFNEIWTVNYGNYNSTQLNDIVTVEESYYALGSILNPNSAYDIVLVAFDESGTLLWEKLLGGEGWDFGNSLTLVSDGLIISGSSYSFSNSESGYAIKTDFAGNIIWEHAVTDPNLHDLKFNDSSELLNGKIAVAGQLIINPDSSFQYVAILDSNGNTLLSQTDGEQKNNSFKSVISDIDENDVFLAGDFYNEDSESIDAIVTRINDEGTVQFKDTFFAPGIQSWNSIELGRFTEILCSGYTRNGGFGNTGFDNLIRRKSRDNIIIDQRSYGSAGNDEAAKAIRLGGSYVMAGKSDGYGSGQYDCLAIRTLEDGSDLDHSIEEAFLETDFSIITVDEPTGENNFMYFTREENVLYVMPNKFSKLEVFNLSGNKIFELEPYTQNLSLPSGMYLIRNSLNQVIKIMVN